ncbi:hypothetical protein AUK05_03100 [Candidatus Shapirobacteria bacterium CG2_30_35_20]|uniref:Peptidase E n=1 Tax=Candidatus Shapirobacteria bacterium CG2_30_35_20 TaxID=1805376 RepID=A0A1J5HPP2_9BACT|nr:MAG: hypothetical protein AUK05_03100 [Candidatus Shapirobacteria bacterium CG2_30_35_20]
MKLYLSSYKFGDNPQQLADLYGENKKVAVIVNAWDVYPDGERRQSGIQKEIDGLSQIGLKPELIDLRNYFNKPEELKNKLNEFGGLWVTGGNTFVLRRAYKESGMDNWLQTHMRDKELVYAGYSAGVCILSPSLMGLETVDEPNTIPDGYKDEIIWDGLNIIDFAFAPHYKSDHPESEMVDNEVEHYQKTGVKFKTLHDGEVIIMETN